MSEAREEYLITVLFDGVTNFRSTFGGWTTDRNHAKHYSFVAATQYKANLLSIAKHDEEHRNYASAEVQPVEEFVEF